MQFRLDFGPDHAGWCEVAVSVGGERLNVGSRAAPCKEFPASYVGPHPLPAFVELAAEALLESTPGADPRSDGPTDGPLDHGFALDGEGVDLTVEGELHSGGRLRVRFTASRGAGILHTLVLDTTARAFADEVLRASLAALATQGPETRECGWASSLGPFLPLEALLVLLHGRRAGTGSPPPPFKDTLLDLAARLDAPG